MESSIQGKRGLNQGQPRLLTVRHFFGRIIKFPFFGMRSILFFHKRRKYHVIDSPRKATGENPSAIFKGKFSRNKRTDTETSVSTDSKLYPFATPATQKTSLLKSCPKKKRCDRELLRASLFFYASTPGKTIVQNDTRRIARFSRSASTKARSR